MFQTLLPLIKTIIENVTQVQVVYDYPESELSGYPAVVILPVAFDNAYLTNQQNIKGYRYRIFVISETAQAGIAAAWNEILPKCVDAIIAALDAAWNQGATAEGHRIWWNVERGDWSQSTEQAGVEVTATLDLIINLVDNT